MRAKYNKTNENAILALQMRQTYSLSTDHRNFSDLDSVAEHATLVSLKKTSDSDPYFGRNEKEDEALIYQVAGSYVESDDGLLHRPTSL